MDKGRDGAAEHWQQFSSSCVGSVLNHKKDELIVNTLRL